jgi:Outer membrane protein beta-barrel domain
MNKLATLALALICAGAVANAQDVRRAKNDVSLMFSYNGIGASTAGSFMGGAGAQWYLADDVALRMGLGFGTTSTETVQGSTTTTVSGTLINLAPGFRLNLASNSNVVGYCGAQVMFGTGSTKTEISGNSNTVEGTQSSLGAGVFFGAEWFPWKNVSLGFEYGLGFMSMSGSDKNGDTEVDRPSTTGIYLGTPATISSNNNDLSISNSSVAITLSLFIN